MESCSYSCHSGAANKDVIANSVASKVMPMGHYTITEQERALIVLWVKNGAPLTQ